MRAFIFVSLFFGIASPSGHAQVDPAEIEAPQAGGAPLTFRFWKDQQIISAQNRLARVTNRLTLLKSKKIREEDVTGEVFAEKSEGEAALINSRRMQKLGANQVIEILEKDREQAAKSVEFARELSVEDYWLVYLGQYQDNPEALSAVAARMSKDEVALLLRALLRAGTKGIGTPQEETRAGARGLFDGKSI